MGILDRKRELFIQPFIERREAPGFFQRFFRSGPANRSRTGKVSIDIKRIGQPVAIAVIPGNGGPDLMSAPLWDTKQFTPAYFNPGQVFSYDEDFDDRQFGQNPFTDVDFRRDLMTRIMEETPILADSIMRAGERQAADVLQTGTATHIDRDGNVVYTIDYNPKATHFPTVTTAWSNAAADIPGDIQSLSDTILDDSGVVVEDLLMGRNAFRDFMRNDEIGKLLNFRRADTISITPGLLQGGARFQGLIDVGSYTYRIWTYNGTFDHEQTGVTTRYLGDDKVIFLSESTRLDKLTARPERPIIVSPEMEAFNPGRLEGGDFDMQPHVWASPDGKNVNLEVGARFIYVPTQIDGYGCLTTTV